MNTIAGIAILLIAAACIGGGLATRTGILLLGGGIIALAGVGTLLYRPRA